MQKILFMSIIFCLHIGPYFGVASADINEALSLEEAISAGLKRSEDIQQSQIEIQRAEAQIKEAWSSVYPHLSASVQPIRHTKSQVLQFNGNAVRVKQDWELLSSLQLEQVVYSFGRVSHALELAKSTRKMQVVAKEVVKRELRYAIEVAYFSTLTAQKVLDIAKDSLKNAKANQLALYKRFQGGRVPRFDNIKMEADVASRAPVVANAQKNLDLAYLQLNLLIENPIKSRPKLTTSLEKIFPKLSSKELIEKSLDNPTLLASEIGVDIAQKKAQLIKAEHYPVISAFGTINHSGTGDSMPPDDDDLFSSSSIGLSINIPIFEGGAVTAKHKQAVLDKVKAEIELKKKQEKLQMELEAAISEYKRNIQTFLATKKATSLAKQAYALTKSRFTTGGATRNDLNDSEKALTNSRIQQQTTLFEIYKNRAVIKKFTQKVVSK
jgi:outer membrane protein TolC